MWESKQENRMPCEDCGHLLCVSVEENSLFCPRCRGLPVESQPVVNAKTDWLLKDHFTDEKIISIVREYSKSNLLYYLITRLNQVSNEFTSEIGRGLPVNEFGYLTYIVKQVYEGTDFGDELLRNPEELEEIQVVKDVYPDLITSLQDARDEFAVCVKRDGFTGRMEDFTSDYELFQSEYGLCFERCVKSIVCGDPEDFKDYSYVADVLRAVDRTDPADVETPRDFADAWFQLLLSLRLIASSDEMVGDVYTTRLPEEVTIFDIEEFFDRIDSLCSDEARYKMREESFVPALDPEAVDRCGREAFGENWDQVKDQIIVSEDNLDAHPFLFELETLEPQRVSGPRRYRYIRTKKIYYPRSFARLMKFQIFPLLKNGDYATGHELLSNLTAERGEVYERNLYDFLSEKGIECYHSAEITRKSPNEIDLLCVFDDRVVFIEVKYLLPPIRINEPEGIRVLKEKFNRLIFNEVSDESSREAEGKPFPEKVDTWQDLDPSDSFSWQVGPDEGDREQHDIPDGWNGLDVKKYVLSNVVPPYIMKDGVRFLTDLELYRLIEHRDKDVLYSVP